MELERVKFLLETFDDNTDPLDCRINDVQSVIAATTITTFAREQLFHLAFASWLSIPGRGVESFRDHLLKLYRQSSIAKPF